MISSKKELEFYIAADRIMAGKAEKKSLKEYIKSFFKADDILGYQRSMRKVAYYKNTSKRGFGYFYHNWRFKKLGVKLGFSIGYNVFGYGLLIPHYGTIVVNERTKAGNFCVLHTSTCIGGEGKVIGDALYLSSGAQLMGSDIELEDNISIAANSMVNKSYSGSNLLLVGMPGTVKKNLPAWYGESSKYASRVKRIKELHQRML
ncbi:serine O-acetyltransferase [Flavobacteriaceae bacterium MAR_2009_75]|nr:serine O-acetyltransferase [Flavobacteriaceae bacterium MAR_2009_75]